MSHKKYQLRHVTAAAISGTISGALMGIVLFSQAQPAPPGYTAAAFPTTKTTVVAEWGDAVTKPTETKPTETKPTETKPTETKPTETKPTETKPTETKPTETKPTETKPTETKPTETKPTETKPTETKPTETKPTETKPTETKPTETKPTETKPTETKPTETKPTETKPTETKPTETKPTETKPTETKPTETKPTETKPTETKPTETKPTETKPTETRPTETKPTETKPTETKPTEDLSYIQEAYLAPGKGWFSLVGTMAEAETIANYNGFDVEDIVQPGWYLVPDGISISGNIAIRCHRETAETTTTETTTTETTTTEATTTTSIEATTVPPEVVQISNPSINAIGNAGFAFGTAEEMLVGCNLQAVKPVNCTGKVAEVTYWLQTLEANGADLNAVITVNPADIVHSDSLPVSGSYSRDEFGYMAISPSSNTAYNVIRRDMRENFGINLVQWREESFGRIRNNGNYGNSTAERMYAEACYVLDYITTGSKYSEYLKRWLDYSGEYYESGYASNQLDATKFNYIGFKIGCYGQTRSEMLFIQAPDGVWYVGVILATSSADTVMAEVGTAINSWFSAPTKPGMI